MALPVAVVTAAKTFLKELPKLLAKLIPGAFGAPRGDFEKFKRTVLPVLAGNASTTGSDSYAFWFGDIIRVEPNGRWGVVQRTGTLSKANEFWNKLAESERFDVFRCEGAVDFNSIDSVAAGCTFETMGTSILPDIGKAGIGGIVALGALGIAAFFALRRGDVGR